ncbi:MAG: hypothetical protein KJ950_04285 [Proteobacteria bacterium]|nr:hypothetical protein [Pseudomonadota bacterium]MBU1688484.1 hypothetical protein [Pseudomonadota bacterium]
MTEKKHLFDEPKNVRRLLQVFFAALGVLLIPDFIFHKHTYFAWEEWPEFYPVFGFVACVVLVLVAKYILRPLVMRRESYYD